MKTSFDKSKAYIKNNLSEKEMNELSEQFLNDKGPVLTLKEAFQMANKKQENQQKFSV
jgi:hypothetical protein